MTNVLIGKKWKFFLAESGNLRVKLLYCSALWKQTSGRVRVACACVRWSLVINHKWIIRIISSAWVGESEGVSESRSSSRSSRRFGRELLRKLSTQYCALCQAVKLYQPMHESDVFHIGSLSFIPVQSFNTNRLFSEINFGLKCHTLYLDTNSLKILSR